MGAIGGDDYLWATLDILAGREEKKPTKDKMAEVEDWLNRVMKKIAKQRKIALVVPNTKEGETQAENIEVQVPTKIVKPKRERRESIKSQQMPEFQYLQTSFGDHIEIQFNFNNPRIRSRLEKLMGSNVVRITDRKYMIKLQERIKEDHMENQKKRIQEREAEEVEREKKLILEGKIPIEAAPKELQNHPVCKINQITKKILEEKKGKGKTSAKGSKAKRPKSSGEKPEKDGPKEQQNGEEEVKVETAEQDDVSDSSSIDQEPGEQVNKVMFKKEDYEKLKYESPLVKMLKEVENVQEMYTLAEEIVGPLKHQKTSQRRKRQEANAHPT